MAIHWEPEIGDPDDVPAIPPTRGALSEFAFRIGRGLSGGFLSESQSTALGWFVLALVGLEVARHLRV